MEQKDDFKLELQQELRGLQQDIGQHSTFNTEEWRQLVKRHTRSLYLKNILWVVFSAVMISASLLIISIFANWPWWLVLPYAIFFNVLIIDNLLLTRGMAHPDVKSKDGLLSLREAIKANSRIKRWRIWFYGSFSTIVLVTTCIYLWFNNRSMFSEMFGSLISAIVLLPLCLFAFKHKKKRHDEVCEEIDKLLKEE